MTLYQEYSLCAKEPGYPEASCALGAVAKEMLFTLRSKQNRHCFAFWRRHHLAMLLELALNCDLPALAS